MHLIRFASGSEIVLLQNLELSRDAINPIAFY